MATNITLSNGQKIWLNIIQGTVLESSESSNSIVSSHRGLSDVITNSSGTYTPPRISTQIVTTSKVWLKKLDGKDAEFNMSDFSVPLRVGHQIAIIYGAAEGIENGAYFGALNKSTGESAFDPSIHCNRLKEFGLYIPKNYYRNWFLRSFVIGAVIGLLPFVDFALGIFIGVILTNILAVILCVVKQVKGQNMLPELNKHALQTLHSAV
ncbi:hypothetical protein [Polaromonas naphthalenivorans]|uniref:hypothetical protein n=1 Tax=Polaromonas naphthalenivorans TaxID=216465 RepID=UPI0012EE484A|nr:hypothetical protein [Polaromonas naphthalenivorans]